MRCGAASGTVENTGSKLPVAQRHEKVGMDFLLRLFGLKTTGAGKITDTAVNFHGVNPVYVFLAAILLTAAVFWMYRRAAEHLSMFRKMLLATLRGLFL